MKKKAQNKQTVTILLVVLVVVIWGAFFVRIFNYSGTIESTNLTYLPVEKVLLQEKIKVDTVKMAYEDPFGMILKKKPKRRVIHVKKKKPIPQKRIVFPTISYNGFIGSKQNINFYIITIRGKQHYLKLGQEVSELKLVSGNYKDVTFLKEGVSKTFSLSK